MADNRGADERIGPGRLVLVVGPSGAGKDTVIRAVRRHLSCFDGAVFPPRVVTRPSSADEDNVVVDQAAFEAAEANGTFTLAWRAHDLRYGVPRTVNDDLRAGRTVVCNVSRTVVEQARQQYSRVVVIEITAPPEVLRRRLLARSRTEDDVDERLARAVTCDADHTIDNRFDIETARNRFLAAIGITAALDVQPT